MAEPKFDKGDYIINRSCGDMGIVRGISKKGYYQFKAYYNGMFGHLNDVKNLNYDLQINYQKFWDLCNEDEKNNLDKLLEEEKKKGGN